MGEALLTVYVWQLTFRSRRASRPGRDERGEGVISAAIAVLIMAFLGVIMWVGFKATLGNTQANVDKQVNEIGR
jgi:type IV secretory pathway VirB6-like protein